MIHLVDHLFMLLLFVVQPIHGARSFAAYVREVEAGAPANRVKLYRQTMIIEWIAFAVLAVTWMLLDRPISALGFVAPAGPGFWICAALVLAGCVALYVGWRKSQAMTEEQKVPHREGLGNLKHMLPNQQKHMPGFFWLSATAGIVEETVYRGFVFWYLLHFMPIWAVVAVSSLAFGLAHTYQGTSGVLKIIAIGIAFGALYIFSGSLWVPIAGHFLFDALQGLSILEIQKKEEPELSAA